MHSVMTLSLVTRIDLEQPSSGVFHLKFQAQSSSCFADLASWMVAHLERHLSVERLTEPV